jgi:hypothetical protein
MAKKRDYKKEYADYGGKPEQKKRRAARNAARREAIKKHGKAALRGKEVDHLGSNPHGDLRKRKTRIVPTAVNRRRQPKRS